MGDFVFDQTGASGRSSTGWKQSTWWKRLVQLTTTRDPEIIASILAAGFGPPPTPVPVPSPSIPVADVTQYTYQFTDIHGNLLAILPLNGFKFEYVLNQAGQWSGTLPVEDPQIAATNWIEATAPNKTCVWVYSGSTLLYGGLVRTRQYTMSRQQVALGGADFVCYLDQRLQAKDYTTTWANGGGSASMAATLIDDALDVANSLPILVALDGTEPSQYYITASFPLSQQQSLSSIFQQLQEMGYLVGFDYACDAGLVAGVPTGVITISYPRRGRVAGTTGLTLDTSLATEFVWAEDGTQQADQVQEMATAFGGVGAVLTWSPAMSADGYPLYQSVQQHAVFSAQTFYTNNEVSASAAVLDAWGADDLALYAYPAVAPKITVPLDSAGCALGDFIVGDDVNLIMNPPAGLPVNPRFPLGLNVYMRIIKCAVTVADEGMPTMEITLNMPPASSPQRPPS